MGRLFWKFFAFVWLAQLGGFIAVGSLFWLTDPRSSLNDLAAGPMAANQVHAGAEVLRYAGSAAFGSWSQHEPGPAVFAVDALGQEGFPSAPAWSYRQFRKYYEPFVGEWHQ